MAAKLIKNEKAARLQLLKSSERLSKIIESAEINSLELEDELTNYEKKLVTLEKKQEIVIENTDEEDLDTIISDHETFLTTQRAIFRDARQKYASLVKPTAKEEDNVSLVGSAIAGSGAHLPKIEIHKFCGDPTKWVPFWDQFSALIDKSHRSPIEKFVYLNSFLKDEAACVISGLAITEANYETAKTLLQERFGRTERVIFSHIQALLDLSRSPNKTEGPWGLYDKLQLHIRSLENLGIEGKTYGVILTPLVLHQLPSNFRLEWARDSAGKEGDLDNLLKFLQAEIQRRERSLSFASTAGQPKQKLPAAKPSSSAAALVAQDKQACALCKKGHPTEKCWEWKKHSFEKRQNIFKELGLCFRCLRKNCYSKICTKTCTFGGCNNGRHHILLCKKKLGLLDETNSQTKINSQNSNENSNDPPTLMSAKCDNPQTVIMQIALIPFFSGTGKQTMGHVLLDTGSSKSYVTHDFVSKIQPHYEGAEPVSFVAFGSRETGRRTMRNVFSLNILCKDGSSASLTATEMPSICAPLFCPDIGKNDLKAFSKLDIVNCLNRQVSIDVLIGLDAYWSFVKPGFVKAGNFVAQETVFGWVLSGTTSQVSPYDYEKTCLTAVTLLSFNDANISELHRFWDLESIGISDSKNNLLQDPVLSDFEKTVVFRDGCYEVSLPWKPNKIRLLQDNCLSAKKRLVSLQRKLEFNPDLKSAYLDYFCDLENRGFIEEVPSEQSDCSYPVFYLPHRPVVRPDSSSTKVRPVFDASASGLNCVSLNDCLFPGPNLLPDLVEILIRFRRWPVAFTGDIQKAFLQIQLAEKDRDVHRFFLPSFDAKANRVMRFKRVTFGLNCSPFLLNAVVDYHLKKQKDSHVVEDLKENLYVDDFLSGGDTSAEVCEVIKDASSILSTAGFTLSKWNSNDPLVGSMLVNDFNDKNLTGEGTTKVLGIKWSAKIDCLGFDGVSVPEGLVITKRVILSFIARLFDPLGFLTPFVMCAKCIFQELWKLGLPWDEIVPDALKTDFLKWCRGLENLKEWQIPRSYTQLPWKGVLKFELHAFGDASQRGYGSCIYLVCFYQTGLIKGSLVISRARVAPLKIQSLPKLELLAAVLTARLLIFVKDALKLPDDTKLKCWTDSQVTLAWIKGDPHRWKTFIANRVVQIHELTDPSLWNFVPGTQNPADLVTRGLCAEDLISSKIWLKGPEFLTAATDTCFSAEVEDGNEIKDTAIGLYCSLDESSVALVANDSKTDSVVFHVDRWSSLSKAIRVVAWVLRFLFNSHANSVKITGDLSLNELTEAKFTLLKCEQKQNYASELSCLESGSELNKGSPIQKLNPFIGEDKLLRVGGRLQFSHLSFDEMHPVILPKGHLSLLLVRNYHLLLKHAGVASLVANIRKHYWIVGLRTLAKRVKRQCLSCKKQDTLSSKQATAPLPEDRVIKAPAFNTTGLDHAGPLFCSDFPGQKFYILLFTCGVVRALHLELVNSLNVFDTALALRRFVARRGLPSVIYSDNAKTFKSIRRLLISFYGHLAPSWKMIAPRSPWWGGFYERMVRSVKSSLRKSLGSSLLTRCELETALHEVEFCLNSRALTFVGDAVDSGYPLSPTHFLVERPMTEFPDFSSDTLNASRELLLSKNDFRNKMLEQFWLIWQHDYLQELPKCRETNSSGELSVGSLVLVKESGSPRLQWPLGCITRVFPGKDGKIRCVELKTSKGKMIKRSVQLLHDLEISSHSSADVLPKEVADEVAPATDNDNCLSIPPAVTTRSGRTVKPKKRVDM